MTSADVVAPLTKRALVSIGLPVFNGEQKLEGVVESVLKQDYELLELVISDNASTDGTEALCRKLAAADSRIVYHRQATNVGLLNNFIKVMQLAKGEFFRWIGDDDRLAPNYISRCLSEFSRDSRLVLVTTQLNYVKPDGSTYTLEFSDTTFYADDPMQRFEKLMSFLIDDSLPLDPLYAMTRRARLLTVNRTNMIREDEVFAAQLALVGPWGHVPEILAERNIRIRGYSGLARLLDLPRWQAHMPTVAECRDMFRFLRTADITPAQRRQARNAVWRLFVMRHHRTLVRRTGKLLSRVLRSPKTELTSS